MNRSRTTASAEACYLIGGFADLQLAVQGLGRQTFLQDLPEIDRSAVITIVSELGANIVKYAGRGSIRVCLTERTSGVDVDVWAEDQGNGIPDVDLAMTDRYSTGGTLGLGLPGVKRMANDFWIRSTRGEGTLVFARKTVKANRSVAQSRLPIGSKRQPIGFESHDTDRLSFAIASRSYADNPFTGDAACLISDGHGWLLAMIDASGHGRVGAGIAGKVLDVVRSFEGAPLERVFESIHQSLKGTSGAAVGLAYLDPVRSTIRYAATGNTRLIKISDRKSWIALPRDGVLGYRLPALQIQEDGLCAGDLLVAWTDGIPDFEGRRLVEKCELKTPGELAKQMVEELAKPYDDACCLALRWH